MMVLFTIYPGIDEGDITLRYSDDSGYYNDEWYSGKIAEIPEIPTTILDGFYGIQEPGTVTVRLGNIDDTLLLSSREYRGRPAQLLWFNPDGGIIRTFNGTIGACDLTDIAEFVLYDRDCEAFDKSIPTDKLTADMDWKTEDGDIQRFIPAVDIGRYIPILFGSVKKTPCMYAFCDYPTNHYDYIITNGYIHSVDAVYQNGCAVDRTYTDSEGVITIQWQLFNGSQTDPYPGYAFLRFTKEQVDFSGSPIQITADVNTGYKLVDHGNTYIREKTYTALQAISSILETIGLTVNELSFDTAKRTFGSSYGYLPHQVAFNITDQVKALDVLNGLLWLSRGYLYRNEDGEYCINVDGKKDTSEALPGFGSGDGYYENIIDIASYGKTEAKEAIKSLAIDYRYGYDAITQTDRYILRTYAYPVRSASYTFGIDKVVECPYVRDRIDADKVAQYWSQRFKYSEEKLAIKTGSEGAGLTVYDLATVSIPRLGITDRIMQVEAIESGATEAKITFCGYDDLIYSYLYDETKLPTDPTDDEPVDYSKTPPAVPLFIEGTLIADHGIEVTGEGATTAWVKVQAKKNTLRPQNFKYITFAVKKTTAIDYTWIDGIETGTDTGIWQATFRGLTPGAIYKIRAASVNHYGLYSQAIDEPEDYIADGDTTPPDAPEIAELTPGMLSISARWNALSKEFDRNKDVETYELYLETASITPDTLRTSAYSPKFSGMATTTTISNLEPETKYYARLFAVDYSGNWSVSTVKDVTTLEWNPNDTEAPAIPTGLAVTSEIEYNSIFDYKVILKLTWNRNSEPDMLGYTVKLLQGSFIYTDAANQTPAGENPIKLISPVLEGTSYTCSVRAGDTNGNWSDYCTAVIHTTVSDVNYPKPPKNVTAASAFKSAFISMIEPDGGWSRNTDRLEIWRRVGLNQSGGTSYAGTLTLAGTTYGNTFYDDVSAHTDRTIYYWACVVNRSGKRNWYDPSNALGSHDYPPATSTVSTIPGLVPITDIEDFYINATSKFSVPALQNDRWTDYPSISTIGWNSHTLWYQGVSYSIPAMTTANKYIWWEYQSNSYSTSDTHPGDAGVLHDNDFVIATNIGGVHDLAWNSMANALIGSAYIMNAAITNAKIADLAVDNAKIADLNAAKITAGDISAARMTLKAATAINDGSTLIEPGHVLIHGSSSLSDWINGDDSTEINGGAIAANTIKANSLSIGNRGITVTGLNIRMETVGATATIIWDAGTIVYLENNIKTTRDIPAGSVSPVDGLVIYWGYSPGTTSPYTTLQTARLSDIAALEDTIIFATYTENNAYGKLNVTYGQTVIDGASITTGSIKAEKLNVSVLSSVATYTGSLKVGGNASGQTSAVATVEMQGVSGSCIKLNKTGMLDDTNEGFWLGYDNDFGACFKIGLDANSKLVYTTRRPAPPAYGAGTPGLRLHGGIISGSTINADCSLISPTIKGGKDGYESTAAGYFMGLVSETAKLHIGDSSKSLKWTGTDLLLNGKVVTGGTDGNIETDTITADNIKAGAITASKIASDFILVCRAGDVYSSHGGPAVMGESGTVSAGTADGLSYWYRLSGTLRVVAAIGGARVDLNGAGLKANQNCIGLFDGLNMTNPAPIGVYGRGTVAGVAGENNGATGDIFGVVGRAIGNNESAGSSTGIGVRGVGRRCGVNGTIKAWTMNDGFGGTDPACSVASDNPCGVAGEYVSGGGVSLEGGAGVFGFTNISASVGVLGQSNSGIGVAGAGSSISGADIVSWNAGAGIGIAQGTTSRTSAVISYKTETKNFGFLTNVNGDLYWNSNKLSTSSTTTSGVFTEGITVGSTTATTPSTFTCNSSTVAGAIQAVNDSGTAIRGDGACAMLGIGSSYGVVGLVSGTSLPTQYDGQPLGAGCGVFGVGTSYGIIGQAGSKSIPSYAGSGVFGTGSYAGLLGSSPNIGIKAWGSTISLMILGGENISFGDVGNNIFLKRYGADLYWGETKLNGSGAYPTSPAFTGISVSGGAAFDGTATFNSNINLYGNINLSWGNLYFPQSGYTVPAICDGYIKVYVNNNAYYVPGFSITKIP